MRSDKAFKRRRLDADAGTLHARQHVAERQIDGAVDFAEILFVHIAGQALGQRREQSACCSAAADKRRSRKRSASISGEQPEGSAESRNAYSITSCSKPRGSMPYFHNCQHHRFHVVRDLLCDLRLQAAAARRRSVRSRTRALRLASTRCRSWSAAVPARPAVCTATATGFSAGIASMYAATSSRVVSVW